MRDPDNSPWRVFTEARDSGDEERALALAWEAVEDHSKFCDGQAAYLRQRMGLYGDIEGLRALRRALLSRIDAGQDATGSPERLGTEIDRINKEIGLASMTRDVIQAVEESPGLTCADLWTRFNVYKGKREYERAIESGRSPAASWIYASTFERYLASPLLRIQGEGPEAKVFVSGAPAPGSLKAPPAVTAGTGCLMAMLTGVAAVTVWLLVLAG